MRLHPISHRTPFYGGTSQRYCGPGAVSALTGRTAECAAAWINFQRGLAPHSLVRSSFTMEVESALHALGYRASRIDVPGQTKVAGFRGPRLTLAAVLRAIWRDPDLRGGSYLIVTTSHYVTARGIYVACTNGNCDRPVRAKARGRRSRVRQVYLVRERAGTEAAAVRRRRTDPMPNLDLFAILPAAGTRTRRPWPRSQEV